MRQETPIEVLVVDDDDLVRRMLVKVLERRGFATREAATGTAALELLETASVDVMLLDQGLPDIDGTEVLARLRAEPDTATLPVILVTGQAEIEARVGGLRAGADDYLVKPVNMDELVARVHAQIRGRNAWRSQVEDKLHERAALAGSLAAIEPIDDPSGAAAMVVEVVRRIPGVRRAWVAAFVGTWGVELLASSDGADPAAENGGTPEIDPLVVSAVRNAIADGATVLPALIAQALFEDVRGDLVATGVDTAGRIGAVVVLETVQSSTEHRGRGQEALSALIDLTPLLERVLMPALHGTQGESSVGSRVREIIASEAFSPVFQPIIELSTGSVRGFEALTRFDDGVRPDQRFAEAARAGVGPQLELATLRRALDVGRELPSGCYLSVNVSASLLVGHDLRELIDTAGDRAMVLELTEHERIDDYAEVRHAVESLGRGIRLSVDDAGSGWASMRHVFSLTPDFVKLDRMWVSRIHTDRARQALLLGMGRFVSELQGMVVAEGIETAQELRALRGLGIEFGQGYLLGHPAPIAEQRDREALEATVRESLADTEPSPSNSAI